MGAWIGASIGESFSRFFVAVKRDKILASLDPTAVKFVYAGPFGGIVVANETVILFRARGEGAFIPVRDVRQAEVNRGILPAGARYLRISYATPTEPARYRIGIDRKNGKLALKAISQAAAAAQVSPPPTVSYSFGWNAVFTNVAIIFAVVFFMMVFAVGPAIAAVMGLVLALVIGLLTLLG